MSCSRLLPDDFISIDSVKIIRADAEFWERNKNAKIKQLEDTIIEQDNTIAENQKLLAEKDAELLRLQKELAKLKQL